jgi:hypothetical protein
MKQRLANVNLKTGKITLDPALKGMLRRRVKIHMTTYLKRRRAGDSFAKAVKAANKEERGNMSMKQWRRYNGKLGAVARWKSRENTIVVR